ncbi:recombinase family protein [Mesorhizobium sp. ORM8.1]
MSKVMTEHLARSAYVYIRQSTADQLTHNHESQRRQHGLVNRANQLGWTDVEVIDDDFGRSGGGITRPRFERLLAAICEARAGAVLAIEASRLARNGRDWHTLIEFCGLVGTIIVDGDGIYDPRHPNDRLLLGMKGTMSELELSLFRQRSQEALKQKARRGALILGVAAGYVKVGRNRIEKNPDQRVQDALQLVFSKFAEFQSVRQVHIWLPAEAIELPVKFRNGGQFMRQANRLQRRMDATARARFPLSPRHRSLPRRRTGRARRDHARRRGRDHWRLQDDGAAHDPSRRHQGPTRCARVHPG